MENHTPPAAEQQYRGSFQELADARRVLQMMNRLSGVPVLPAEDRAELQRVRAHAIRCIEAATAELIDTLDVTLGDPDLENATDLEDEGLSPHAVARAAEAIGCPVADPGGGNVEDEGEGIDEREPENGDAVVHTGVDQSRRIGPDNPVVL